MGPNQRQPRCLNTELVVGFSDTSFFLPSQFSSHTLPLCVGGLTCIKSLLIWPWDQCCDNSLLWGGLVAEWCTRGQGWFALKSRYGLICSGYVPFHSVRMSQQLLFVSWIFKVARSLPTFLENLMSHIIGKFRAKNPGVQLGLNRGPLKQEYSKRVFFHWASQPRQGHCSCF